MNITILADINADAVANFITGFSASHPTIFTVLAVIGACRLLIKPLFTFLHEVAKVTPSDWDNKIVDSIENSKAFSWAVWALDWITSIKLVNPNAVVASAVNAANPTAPTQSSSSVSSTPVVTGSSSSSK